MSKQAKQAQPKAPAGHTEPFTGVAFTVQASNTQGFPNYRICTLFVVDGQIVHIEKSQEFATFEAISRTEIQIHSAIWNLSSRYQDGDYQSLGGEHRDALIARLSNPDPKRGGDPELLERIMPALYPNGSGK